MLALGAHLVFRSEGPSHVFGLWSHLQGVREGTSAQPGVLPVAEEAAWGTCVVLSGHRPSLEQNVTVWGRALRMVIGGLVFCH